MATFSILDAATVMWAPFLPIVVYLLVLGFTKAFIEPLSQELAITAFRKFVQPTWDRLDEQLLLPGSFEKWATQGKAWIYQVVLPDEAKRELTPNQIAALLEHLESNFEIKLLRKKKGLENG